MYIPVRETSSCEVQLKVDQSHNQAKQCINEYLHEGWEKVCVANALKSKSSTDNLLAKLVPELLKSWDF